MHTNSDVVRLMLQCVQQERKRIVALLLAEVGRLRVEGQREAADVVDRLALRVEHPEA